MQVLWGSLFVLYIPASYHAATGDGANWGVGGRRGNLDIGDGVNSMREDAYRSSRICLARK
jgi:hypothetical protein